MASSYCIGQSSSRVKICQFTASLGSKPKYFVSEWRLSYPHLLFSWMRHSAKTQKNPGYLDDASGQNGRVAFQCICCWKGELVLIDEENEWNTQDPTSGEPAHGLCADQGGLAGGSPSQASRKAEAMWGPQYPIVLNAGFMRTSLAVLWLGLHASTVGSTASISGWRTRIPHGLRCSQKLKNFKK